MANPLELREAEVAASRGVVAPYHPLASDGAVAAPKILNAIGTGSLVIRDSAPGLLRGAACQRADGTPIGINGGPAWMAGPSLPGLA